MPVPPTVVTTRQLATGEVVSSGAADGSRSFESLLPSPVREAALSTLSGDTAPSATPIQAECWRWLLDPSPPDLVAISPTGSGKTLAFLVPAFNRLLSRRPPVGASVDEAAARARADAAMRATAKSSFARAAAEGADSESARAIAREEAKVAYKRALREARAEAAAGCGGDDDGGAADEDGAAADGAERPVCPTVLVLAPTRELGLQISATCESLAAHLAASLGGGRGLSAGCVVGGVDFHRQRAAVLSSRPSVLVATPGRLLSLCGETPASSRARALAQREPAAAPSAAPSEPGACIRLHRVSYLVLDEADRLLDLGFEDDVSAVVRLMRSGGAPPPRPTLMFSATWDARTQTLASRLMASGALHVTVGLSELSAAATVAQGFEVMAAKGAPRFRRLVAMLREQLCGFAPECADDDDDDEWEEAEEEGEAEAEELAALAEGCAIEGDGADEAGPSVGPRVIVFVVHKQEAKSLCRALDAKGLPSTPLHGDQSQAARSASVLAFRRGERRVLVATDVASRGLDVPGVTHVVNYSLGLSIDSYVHRVGRAGRAGRAGFSHTFLIEADEPLVPELVALLERSRLRVDEPLRQMARRAEQRAARKAVARERAVDVGDESDEDEDEERAQRMANREKQLAMHQQKQRREKQQMRGGKGGGKGRR